MRDLVERLRMHASWRDSQGELNDAPNLAAAEIERLRAALERIAERDGDGLETYTPQAMCAIARAALENRHG